MKNFILPTKKILLKEKIENGVDKVAKSYYWLNYLARLTTLVQSI